jgi:zinc protease
MASSAAFAQPRIVELHGTSPLVTIRLVFTTGSASDPADKPGVANLTAELLGNGGTKDLAYRQIVDAMYPMAAQVQVYSDKEMTTFTGETHIENLEKFYGLMRDMMLHPGWRADDLTRVRDSVTNQLRVGLRGNNDEELGKEVLYTAIYAGHPYGHENLGAGSALAAMTMADLEAFYKQNYTQGNLMIGLAGGYPAGFAARVQKDFSALPAGKAGRISLPQPAKIERNQVTLVEKDTRSVAWSFGFPIDVKRGDPDFAPLLVMQSWFGQHRSDNRLYDRMREIRGLNYGDYVYIEYFPRGMFFFEPEPNLARQQQIFQVWIRPVEPDTATFALRLAMYELDKLVKDGMTKEDFERTRTYLTKYVNVLTKSGSAALGYAIDSRWYAIPNYNEYLKSALAKVTLDDVNRAIRKHLRSERIQIAGIAKDVARLRSELSSDAATPMHYNSDKPKEILDEDRIVEKWPLHIRQDDIKVVPVAGVFEK